MVGRWSNPKDPKVQDFMIGLVIGIFATLIILCGAMFNSLIHS